jgi:hypothetical protein
LGGESGLLGGGAAVLLQKRPASLSEEHSQGRLYEIFLSPPNQKKKTPTFDKDAQSPLKHN